MSENEGRVPLADGWRIGPPDERGYCHIYAPDGSRLAGAETEWLAEHGQPVPDRPLQKGDRVRHSFRGEGIVEVAKPDRSGLIIVDIDGDYRAWGIANVERVSP